MLYVNNYAKTVRWSIVWDEYRCRRSNLVSLHAVFLGASGHGVGDLLPALRCGHRERLQRLLQQLLLLCGPGGGVGLSANSWRERLDEWLCSEQDDDKSLCFTRLFACWLFIKNTLHFNLVFALACIGKKSPFMAADARCKCWNPPNNTFSDKWFP